MYNIDFVLVGNLIKFLRINNNMTQSELAKSIGKTKAAISQWENGGGIKGEELYNIARFFGITVDELCKGKLNEENDESFIKRKYALEEYKIDKIKNDKDVKNLKIFYERCVLVKNRFFDLLVEWAKDNLNDLQEKEFKFVEKYFSFDYNFFLVKYPSNEIFKHHRKEKENVLKVYEIYKNEEKEIMDWELSKLYDFKVDLKEKEIIESCLIKPFELLIDFYTQVYKDVMLKKYIKKNGENISLNGIEKDCFIKIMINKNCRILYDFNDVDIPMTEFEDVSLIKGKIVYKQDLEKLNKESGVLKGKWYYLGVDGATNMKNNWKYLSLEEYKNYVNEELTEKIKLISNLKNSKPLEYFNSLIKIDKEFVDMAIFK